MENQEISRLKSEMEDELRGNILPFWVQHAVDSEYGGFYGKISNDLKADSSAEKGGVLNARILWTYARAYMQYGEVQYKDMADRAYRYIIDNFIDKEQGGVYWLLDNTGMPADTKKQIYAQAFTIYGFVEYYEAFKNTNALDEAIKLFHLIETHAYDPVNKGYFEAANRGWEIGQYTLDDKCGAEQKSMNTMLHILEAYTSLYRVWKNEDLYNKLIEIIEIFLTKIINGDTNRFKLFFDDKWNSLNADCSFGHDIEGSWLLDEAAQVAGDTALIEKVRAIAVNMAEAAIEGIDSDNGLAYEGNEKGITDSDRNWWPQAEAVVGFFNAFEISGNKKYLDTAINSWDFIRRFIIDWQYGEWYWGKRRDGSVIRPDAKVDMWKCCYHNSRACFEIMKRAGL